MSPKKKTGALRPQPDTGRPEKPKRRQPDRPPNLPPKLSATILQKVLPAYIDPIVRRGKRPDGVRLLWPATACSEYRRSGLRTVASCMRLNQRALFHVSLFSVIPRGAWMQRDVKAFPNVLGIV